MKPGTIVELPDGRRGTVVYHGLDGYGIKWGERKLNGAEMEEILRGDGNTVSAGYPSLLNPDAMLRDPYPSADVECVGREYEIVEATK